MWLALSPCPKLFQINQYGCCATQSWLLPSSHRTLPPFCLAPLQSATRHFRQSFHCLPVNYSWPLTPPFLTSCTVLSIMAYFSVVGFSHLTVRWVELFVFIHFLGRLLCLYDKSFNTANLSSVNGRKGWRKQKNRLYHGLKRWMHSYNPKTGV